MPAGKGKKLRNKSASDPASMGRFEQRIPTESSSGSGRFERRIPTCEADTIEALDRLQDLLSARSMDDLVTPPMLSVMRSRRHAVRVAPTHEQVAYLRETAEETAVKPSAKASQRSGKASQRSGKASQRSAKASQRRGKASSAELALVQEVARASAAEAGGRFVTNDEWARMQELLMRARQSASESFTKKVNAVLDPGLFC